MRIANPYRYQLLQPTSGGSGVMKLHFGASRYFIIKGKSMIGTVKTVSVELDRRIRLGADPDHIYHRVVQYIHRGRITVFRVEILLESDDPLELLQREHQELTAGSKDANCLNNGFDVYIPAWIPQETVSQFNEWKKPKPTKKHGTAKKSKDPKVVPAGRSPRKARSVPDGKRGDTGVGRKKKGAGPVQKEPEGDHHQ